MAGSETRLRRKSYARSRLAEIEARTGRKRPLCKYSRRHYPPRMPPPAIDYARLPRMTVEEYLAFEEESDVKHEYAAGYIG